MVNKVTPDNQQKIESLAAQLAGTADAWTLKAYAATAANEIKALETKINPAVATTCSNRSKSMWIQHMVYLMKKGQSRQRWKKEVVFLS